MLKVAKKYCCNPLELVEVTYQNGEIYITSIYTNNLQKTRPLQATLPLLKGHLSTKLGGEL